MCFYKRIFLLLKTKENKLTFLIIVFVNCYKTLYCDWGEFVDLVLIFAVILIVIVIEFFDFDVGL